MKLTLALVSVTIFVSGCASSSDNAASRPSENGGKAKQKISMAIGEETNNFTLTNQRAIDAPAGYEGAQYTVNTNSGKTFKCEILEPSGFGKAITFGTSTGASAMCTDFSKDSKDKGKTNKASCNALLQAAGKC